MSLCKDPPSNLALIIDAHAHLGAFRNFHIPGHDADGLIAAMDSFGIDRTVLSAHAAISSDVRRGNDETTQAVRAFPDRLAGYCVVNPNYPDEVAEELDRCFASGCFVGIKLHPELHGDYPLDGPGYQPMWAFANDRRLPVLTHTYFGGDRIEVIELLAQTYGDSQILIGHAGLDLGLDQVAAAVNDHDNLWLELCGALSFRGHVEVLAERVPVERLLLGTDMPFINAASQLGTLLFADLPREDIEKIAGGNARVLFERSALP